MLCDEGARAASNKRRLTALDRKSHADPPRSDFLWRTTRYLSGYEGGSGPSTIVLYESLRGLGS